MGTVRLESTPAAVVRTHRRTVGAARSAGAGFAVGFVAGAPLAFVIDTTVVPTSLAIGTTAGLSGWWFARGHAFAVQRRHGWTMATLLMGVLGVALWARAVMPFPTPVFDGTCAPVAVLFGLHHEPTSEDTEVRDAACRRTGRTRTATAGIVLVAWMLVVDLASRDEAAGGLAS